MPKARVVSRKKMPAVAIVLVALLGLLAFILWQKNGGLGPADQPEPFRSFQNLTGFSSEQVWTAYRFAVANPSDVLNYIPCFCGCVYHGDTNNRDCYINGFKGQGRPIFDPHAAG